LISFFDTTKKLVEFSCPSDELVGRACQGKRQQAVGLEAVKERSGEEGGRGAFTIKIIVTLRTITLVYFTYMQTHPSWRVLSKSTEKHLVSD
jgi:hypothetical protein